MATPDWEAIKDGFDAALSAPPSEREAFVDRTYGDRPEIARAVRDLLRAHLGAASGFLAPGSIALRAEWAFAAGDVVADRFRVVRPIARGAMGEVYEVYDQRLRLAVALKAIRPEFLTDPDTVERFRREVLVTRDTAHPGICRVFDLVEHHLPASADGTAGRVLPCLTMQLLQGESLDEWLRTRRPVPTADALPLVAQVAEALHVLHESGIVHRDLKPSNVVIVGDAPDRRAVLTDFGLARPVDPGLFETQGPSHGGAPFFMAPELFKGARPSRASDIYALGLLIDELVTERSAFQATSLHGLLLEKLGDGPEAPGSRATNLPRVWQHAIARCLAPDPARRPRTAREVAAALSAPAGWRQWRPIRLRRSDRRKRSPARLAGCTVIASLFLLGSVGFDAAVLGATPQSLAIAGIENRTGRSDLAYLATGTVTELTRRLGSTRAVRLVTVPANGSAANGTTYLLSGHVQSAPSGIRLTVAIADASTRRVAWTQTFEGPLDRALQLEEQLAAETVQAMLALRRDGRTKPGWLDSLVEWAFSPASAARTSGTSNPAAFDAYLRGRVLYEDRTVPSALKAIEFLNRAVALDPAFAAPYATLADVNTVLMELRYGPHDVLLAEADRYASQALELDPHSPEAALSLAAVRQMQWRWQDADAAYRRAIELNPTSRALRWYGGLLLQFGRFDEGLALYHDAIALDPLDFPTQSALGHALFTAGRVQEATVQLETVIAQRDLYYSRALLGQAYAYLVGQEPEKAREHLRRALQQADVLRARGGETGSPARAQYADLVAALAWSYAGDREGARPFLEELEAGHAAGHVPDAMLARVYAAQGRIDEAVQALLRAEAVRDRELLYVSVTPIYRPLRGHPGFTSLVRRLHLTD